MLANIETFSSSAKQTNHTDVFLFRTNRGKNLLLLLMHFFACFHFIHLNFYFKKIFFNVQKNLLTLCALDWLTTTTITTRIESIESSIPMTIFRNWLTKKGDSISIVSRPLIYLPTCLFVWCLKQKANHLHNLKKNLKKFSTKTKKNRISFLVVCLCLWFLFVCLFPSLSLSLSHSPTLSGHISIENQISKFHLKKTSTTLIGALLIVDCCCFDLLFNPVVCLVVVNFVFGFVCISFSIS